MRKPNIKILGLIIISVAVLSCKKNNITDEELYESSLESGYQYYKNSTDTLNPASASPHGIFRARFNAVAQKSLDADGKLPENSSFEEGAVIVKEVYGQKGGPLTLLAIMKKAPKSKNAGKDWLWGEYKPGGETVFSVSKKGDGCVSCHSASNRDLTRIFDLH